MRAKIIQLLVENIRIYLCDFGVILDMMLKAQATNENINKLNFTVENFVLQRTLLKK